ncbi:hypothetical protein CDAR_489471 [Caerostris darwini]|uniref:Uncharacterized protein n=1 Tax=Caerostris darwini TaxID=1538125 RepID=A0AAV4U072_9ARAC|nr:hypothetical protein CDAR_489471 [Caerostris darwini]
MRTPNDFVNWCKENDIREKPAVGARMLAGKTCLCPFFLPVPLLTTPFMGRGERFRKRLPNGGQFSFENVMCHDIRPQPNTNKKRSRITNEHVWTRENKYNLIHWGSNTIRSFPDRNRNSQAMRTCESAWPTADNPAQRHNNATSGVVSADVDAPELGPQHLLHRG